MLGKASGAEDCTRLAADSASPSLTLICPHWMHDWEENWSIKESCKSACELLGKESPEEAVLLCVAVL